MNCMTNFALMMQVLNLSPQVMAAEMHTDTTLISRWRTGNRRLMPGRMWTRNLAGYLCAKDTERETAVLPRLLANYWPDLDYAQPAVLLEAMEAFLTVPEQMDPAYRQQAADWINETLAGEIEPLQIYMPLHIGSARTAAGAKAVRKMALTFISESLKLCATHEVVFFCPRGMELLTQESKTAENLASMATQALKREGRLSVICGSEYKPSDVEAFTGLWMAAHMKGSIVSYNHDTFNAQDDQHLIVVIRAQMALSVTYGEDGNGVAASVYMDPDAVSALYARVKAYETDEALRIRRGYLADQAGYLRDMPAFPGGANYVLMQLPQFGHMPIEDYHRRYRLTRERVVELLSECRPLLQPVWDAPDGTPVRHVYSLPAIEEVLLESRRMLPAMSELCGKRVFMSSQDMVDILKRMRAMLTSRHGYEVCFLGEGAYVDLGMQVMSWGNECMICWTSGQHSVASKGKPIASALHHHCREQWERIPAHMRSRTAALKQIDQWLRKAQYYGLNT